jgi:hypothetical protein
LVGRRAGAGGSPVGADGGRRPDRRGSSGLARGPLARLGLNGDGLDGGWVPRSVAVGSRRRAHKPARRGGRPRPHRPGPGGPRGFPSPPGHHPGRRPPPTGGRGLGLERLDPGRLAGRLRLGLGLVLAGARRPERLRLEGESQQLRNLNCTTSFSCQGRRFRALGASAGEGRVSFADYRRSYRLSCFRSGYAFTPATQPIPQPRYLHSTWYTNRSKVRQ